MRRERLIRPHNHANSIYCRDHVGRINVVHRQNVNNEYINERNDLRHPRMQALLERAPERFQEVFILKGVKINVCYR